MKKYGIVLIVLIISVLKTYAQQIETFELGKGYLFSDNNVDKGKIILVQDVRIRRLLEKGREFNKNGGNKIDGWRLQIYLSSEPKKARQEAEAIKRKFEVKYPDVSAYVKFEAPFFKVKVGDFRSKNEALMFKRKLSSEFSNCYPIKDEINPPKMD